MLTVESSPVSLDPLEAYRERGFCIVDDVYSSSELQEIEDYFEDYIRRPDSRFEGNNKHDGSNAADVDPTKQQLRVLHPHRDSEKVLGWFLHPRVANVLETLLGRPALGAQTMYYFKPPGGKGQGMHQDNFYLLAHPATCIGVWTPIDDADEENGCLYVAPRSHQREIFCPEASQDSNWLNYGDSHIRPFPREFRPEPLPVRRGQTLFFSGHLIHGSGPNRTKDRWRRTFIGHYVDEATDTLSKFYHPVLDMQGRVVSHVAEHQGGGPCGDGSGGGVH